MVGLTLGCRLTDPQLYMKDSLLYEQRLQELHFSVLRAVHTPLL